MELHSVFSSLFFAGNGAGSSTRRNAPEGSNGGQGHGALRGVLRSALTVASDLEELFLPVTVLRQRQVTVVPVVDRGALNAQLFARSTPLGVDGKSIETAKPVERANAHALAIHRPNGAMEPINPLAKWQRVDWARADLASAKKCIDDCVRTADSKSGDRVSNEAAVLIDKVTAGFAGRCKWSETKNAIGMAVTGATTVIET
ncbi:MAG TPA: hypothetical protein VLJ86_00575, partial [Ramlibacter sp.]|nr:hypothetical protein [Ramlibacter sp.]